MCESVVDFFNHMPCRFSPRPEHLFGGCKTGKVGDIEIFSCPYIHSGSILIKGPVVRTEHSDGVLIARGRLSQDNIGFKTERVKVNFKSLTPKKRYNMESYYYREEEIIKVSSSFPNKKIFVPINYSTDSCFMGKMEEKEQVRYPGAVWFENSSGEKIHVQSVVVVNSLCT